MGSRERETGNGFFSRANFRPISLAFAVAMFNQLSGINAVLYFARRIFEMAGFSSSAALKRKAGLKRRGSDKVGEWYFDQIGKAETADRIS